MDCKILKLKVENFRNLSSDVFNFSKNINCIIGENGNGKTNILEAIYFISKRKSFRKNTSFPQLLSIDGEKPEIKFQSLFEVEDEQLNISASMSQSLSKWFINGKALNKKPSINIVFINPFESYGFHSIPSERRNWFDKYLSLLSVDYKKELSKYNQSLRQRNVLLSKKPHSYKQQIQAIDLNLSKYISQLNLFRENFVKEVSPLLIENYFKIFSEKCTLTIHHDSSIPLLDSNEIYNSLQNNLERDLVLGHTEKGSHRDDYVLLYNGINSFDYCSLGQQKMSYLSLLFAYIDLFRYKFKAYPIVLIDDVSGELDRVRWKKLISFLDKCEFQVLITTANEKFKEELEKIENANQIYVSKGSLVNN